MYITPEYLSSPTDGAEFFADMRNGRKRQIMWNLGPKVPVCMVCDGL